MAKQTLVKLLYSTYSQDQELEADIFGIRIADAAAYNPKAALSFMQRLKDKRQDKAGLPIEKYFSTHPMHEVRLRNMVHYLSGNL